MRVSQFIIAAVVAVIVAMASTVLAAGPEQVFTPSVTASNPSGLHAVSTVTSLPRKTFCASAPHTDHPQAVAPCSGVHRRTPFSAGALYKHTALSGIQARLQR